MASYRQKKKDSTAAQSVGHANGNARAEGSNRPAAAKDQAVAITSQPVAVSATAVGSAPQTQHEESTKGQHPVNDNSHSVAARVLARLEEIDSHMSRLSNDIETRTVSSERELNTSLQQMHSLITSDTLSLATRVSEALGQQSIAIAEIGSAVRQLQTVIQETANRPAPAPAASVASEPTTKKENVEQVLASLREKTTTTSAAPKQSSSTKSTWEEIRSAFLQEHDKGGDKPPVAEPVVAELRAPEPVDEPLEEQIDIPSIADPSLLSEDELRKIVIDRERLISTLIRRVQKKSRQTPICSSEQLANLRDGLPQDLAARVDQSLAALNEQIRLGELELSLERARVSRQLATLAVTREKLDGRARSMGLSISEDGAVEGEIDAALKRGSKGRRWLGVMGFGN